MQETLGQAFKRRPLEMILLFTIGLPLLPFIVIFLYVSNLFRSASVKKEFNKLSDALTGIENELRASNQSKKEYLQRCTERIFSDPFYIGDLNKEELSDLLKSLMVKQTQSDLQQLDCDIGGLSLSDNPNIVEETVERIFRSAEGEIDFMLKRKSLVVNIPQSHNSEHGAFFNAYQDLTAIYDADYPKFSDVVKKAYGFARIKLGAMLLLQGILSDTDFKEEQSLFPDIDMDEDNFESLDMDVFGVSILVDDYIFRYEDWSDDNVIEPRNWEFALPFVYDGRITSRMVGPIRRSQWEVLNIVSRLEDVAKAEDDFSLIDYCGSKNIYECLLGSDEKKQYSEGPLDDDEIPY